VEYLMTHDSTILLQVIATEVSHLSAQTEPQIEAIARQHF
jgi:hypothetical protein